MADKCAWCDRDAVTQIELRPATWTGAGKNRRMKMMPYMVHVCPDHRDIVRNQPAFYTCGCSKVEGEDKCPVHDTNLRKQFRDEK
jgi:hypothetical protein